MAETERKVCSPECGRSYWSDGDGEQMPGWWTCVMRRTGGSGFGSAYLIDDDCHYCVGCGAKLLPDGETEPREGE